MVAPIPKRKKPFTQFTSSQAPNSIIIIRTIELYTLVKKILGPPVPQDFITIP
jgi:hypothetical protein